MVVDHAHGLHVGVAHRGAHEGEAPAFEVRTEAFRLGSGGGKIFRARPGVLAGLVFDEAPHVAGEGAEMLLHFQKSSGVAQGAGDLAAVTDDGRIFQKAVHVVVAHAGHGLGIEIEERPTVPRAFF